ncbi:MAG: hypothetical protein ACM3JH_05845, partial [Acidithiobacillales bacterium]
MKEQVDGGVRFVVPAALADSVEESLFERFGGIPLSATRGADGELSIGVDRRDAAETRAILARLGAGNLTPFEEIPRDWVAEAAALRQAVVVGPYLLDPHEGRDATPPSSGQVRLWLPAARA